MLTQGPPRAQGPAGTHPEVEHQHQHAQQRRTHHEAAATAGKPGVQSRAVGHALGVVGVPRRAQPVDVPAGDVHVAVLQVTHRLPHAVRVHGHPQFHGLVHRAQLVQAEHRVPRHGQHHHHQPHQEQPPATHPPGQRQQGGQGHGRHHPGGHRAGQRRNHGAGQDLGRARHLVTVEQGPHQLQLVVGHHGLEHHVAPGLALVHVGAVVARQRGGLVVPVLLLALETAGQLAGGDIVGVGRRHQPATAAVDDPDLLHVLQTVDQGQGRGLHVTAGLPRGIDHLGDGRGRHHGDLLGAAAHHGELGGGPHPADEQDAQPQGQAKPHQNLPCGRVPHAPPTS